MAAMCSVVEWEREREIGREEEGGRLRGLSDKHILSGGKEADWTGEARRGSGECSGGGM